RALAGIIDRALAKDRAARWQKIDEMANAIRVASGDAAVVTQRAPSVPAPPTTVERPAVVTASRQRTAWTGKLSVPTEDQAVQPQRARSKLPITIGAVAVAAVGIGIGVYALRGRDAPSTPPPPSAPSGSAPVAIATPDAAPAPPPLPPPQTPALPA